MSLSGVVGRRSIELRSLAIAVVTTLGVTLCAFFLLYRFNMDARTVQLMEMVRSQARLMEAVGKFDAFFQSDEVPGAARSATLSQIRESHRRYSGFGESGEIVLALEQAGEIVFLLPTRKRDFRIPAPVALDSELAGPMKLALEGGTGVVVARDHSGSEVLAAYEWLPFLEMGLVCKIDMGEIRAPFVRTALITAAVALGLILVGAVLTSRMVSPLVERIERSRERLQHELSVTRALADEADREHEVALMGESVAMRGLQDAVQLHARSDEPLLLTGPPGAGQQAVARRIHRSSARRQNPFIFVDCGRLAVDDTASLFQARPRHDGVSLGRAELADRGTLYLENVQDLSRERQERLAAYLRDSADKRGAGQTPVPDIRVIAYAASGLDEAVREGKLGSELVAPLGFHRLAVPSLAERRDDIPILAARIVKDHGRARGQVFDGIEPRSLARMIDYDWPGNVIELRNVLERSVVVSDGPLVEVGDDFLDHSVHLGGYRLVRRIGGGGMADVWLARHDLLARPAAVKLIRRDLLAADGEGRRNLQGRFEQEARVTAQLRSPHTVELYDFGSSESGQFYYVMEHLEGTDLGSLLEDHGALEPERVVHLLAQACLSLAEAHEAGLVHRDIKPSNLFVGWMGPQADFLKVLDFGIVKALDSAPTEMTETGAVPGTPGFVAPELMFSKSPPDGRADLYALACVAYLLLTGREVFEAESSVPLFHQHLRKTPDAPSACSPRTIPEELDRIVLQCLEKTPEKRPASALELRTMLLRVPLSQPWTEERAAAWWHAHGPDTLPTRFQDS